MAETRGRVPPLAPQAATGGLTCMHRRGPKRSVPRKPCKARNSYVRAPPQRLCWRWARALLWIIHDVSSMDGFHHDGGGPLGRGWAPHRGRSKARQQHPGLARGADALPRLAYVSADPTPWEHSAPVIEVTSRIDVVRACGVPSRDRPPRRFYGQPRRSRGGGGERAGVTLAPPAVHGADSTAQRDCPADFPT